MRSRADTVKLHSGVEERYLGRLITSRRRFDSGLRNKQMRAAERRFSHLLVAEEKQVSTCFVRNRKPEDVRIFENTEARSGILVFCEGLEQIT